MDARRPRARRADHRRDRSSGSTRTRPTTGSSSTASRAPIGQAEALEEALEKLGRRLTAALLIDAPDEEVVAPARPAAGPAPRTATSSTSSSTRPSTRASATWTARALIQRDDDKPEMIRKRLDVYHEQTEPLIDYYEERGLLRRFDGTRAPDEVARPHPRDARRRCGSRNELCSR